MISSFADPKAERVFRGERIRKLPPEIQRTARRKLRQMDAADRLDDLRTAGQSPGTVERLYASTI